MEQLHHHHLYPAPNVNPPPPSWTEAETRELLAIRSELDRTFMETKRNKSLWESVSSSMHLKGFHRTPDQCKSKWKNLVTRFKGSDANQQFPFFDEMQRIYADRMARLLNFEATQEQVESDDDEVEERVKKRRKRGGGVEGVLKELARWQREREARWVEEAEAREAERRSREEEWRRALEEMWEERAAMELRWREREEERRAREEARAERQHQLLTAIVAKLAGDGD